MAESPIMQTASHVYSSVRFRISRIMPITSAQPMRRSLSNMSACRKSLFSPRGAGIHRRPSRFPGALPPDIGGATGRKNLFFPLPLLSELAKVLIIFDFNGAGKQAKRRRWRIKRVCFEEGSQSADIKYPLIGLSRRCIPSWVSRTHPFFPSRKSPLAALRLFPLLGLSPR